MIQIVFSATTLQNPQEDSNNRKLEQIDSSTINATILKEKFLDKLINFGLGEGKKNIYKEWRAEIFSEEKLNMHLNDEIIFEIDIKTKDEKKILEISNTDEEKFIRHKITHAFFSRQLKKNENTDDLDNFLKIVFENMTKLLETKEETIQSLFKNHLLPFLDKKGYKVSSQKRLLESQKNSIVLDIYSNDKTKRYFQILIYNVNSSLFGMDFVSILKTYQIRLGKDNLKNNFKNIEISLNNVITDEAKLDQEKAILEFGAEFDVKTNEVVKIISEFCNTDISSNLESKEGNISVIDLTQMGEDECVLGQNKIFIGQVNSLYLQYFYIKVDNQFFEVDYMLGFTMANIKKTLPDVLKEISNEIEEVKKLKDEEKEVGEDIDLQKIYDGILEIATETGFQLDCGEGVKEERITCLHNEKESILASKVKVGESNFFKIKLLHKDKGISKVVDNELKIPEEDKIGLLKRGKDSMRKYMSEKKVRI